MIVTESEAEPAEEKALPIHTKVIYSSPSVVLAAVAVMVSTFTPRLYSDEYNVPLRSIGFISIAALVLDAFSDPAIGYLSDVTRSSYGRRRPFILLGGVSMGIVTFCLLSPPVDILETTSGAIVWASVFIMLIMLTTTLVRVPWFALSYELTAGTYQEKKNLYATREIFYIVGTIGAAALPLIIAVDDVKLQFQIIGAILATVSIFLSFLCFWYVKEPRYGMLEESGNSGGLVQLFSNYWKLFGIIRKNTIAFPFLLGITLFSGATYLNSFFFAYYVTYVVDAEDQLEVALILYIVSGIMCIPVWVQISKRIEKHYLIKFAMAMQSILLLIAYVVGKDISFTTYAVLVAFAGVSFGAFGVFKSSMLADIVDILENSQEEMRCEGEIQGIFDLCGKCTSALLVGPALITLDYVGYQPNEQQPQGSITAILMFYSLVPGALGMIAFWIILQCKITKSNLENLPYFK